MSGRDRFRVKVGVVPTERYPFGIALPNLTVDAQTRLLTKLRELGVDFVTLDGVTDRGSVYSMEQVDAIVRHLLREGVDAVFFPHINFGTEEAVAHIAREVNKPVLLWGEMDGEDRSGWHMITDRQCGLFATSYVLRHFNVPFSYIINCRLDDPEFAEGMERFIGAVRVVKAFRRLRIGQIGTRPGRFLTMMYNERELLEKFGITVVPLTLIEIIDEAKALLGTEEQKEESAKFQTQIPLFETDNTGVDKLAALKLAMGRWAERNACDALVIQCWQAIRTAYGIGTCLANASLTEEGLPVLCEADVHAAVGAVMLQAAVGENGPSTFIADLTARHPHNPNAELLWHCGVFPLSLWDGESQVMVNEKGQCNWRIKGGDITVTRFGGDRGEYSLIAGQGWGVDGPETFGTYVWMEVNDWPAWERRFIEGPYVHHVNCVHGKVVDVLEEATKYIPNLGFERLP